ncbi:MULTISPECIES: restriction endonuclease subunit S [unclassified Rathayibacter]|uniref:restriction endonuclease subunit S n=1 Tax=unclassified Rathayibacter TaxID=2609250 RepID=UPI000CE8996C|nr:MULTISPECIES: restriction endonuclease subunit S [unclassified Rathayibacter]PPF73217.1 hypothetical protein C5C46_04795 [Rathayibacter sp. AY1E6]PPH08676.1 hypothetical protein C5C33_04840 [Rathayibacter sp. AY1H3]
MTKLKPYPEYQGIAVPWLEKAPMKWSLQALRYLAVVETGTKDTIDSVPNGSYPFVVRSKTLLSIDSFTYDTEAILTAGDGDVGEVFHHLTGKFDVHQRVYVLRNFRTILPRFLYYYFSSQFKRVVAYGGALTTVASLRRPMFTSFPVLVPSRDEQLAICAFLNRETAEIDAFIADQEELIALLAERRDACWQSAIDGLNVTDVPLRRVTSSVTDGPFGSSLTSAHYSDEGARVVRLGNIGINSFKDADRAFIPLPYFADLVAHSLRAGDVVVAGLGDDRMPLGRAAVVPDLGPAIVKADCYRVRSNGLVTGEYLAWVLSAPQTRARFTLMARGSTRQRLNTAVVQDVFIPLPSLDEQRRVVNETSEIVGTLDAAIADAREAIALSKERRAALISAAVTGKIDVRGVA